MILNSSSPLSSLSATLSLGVALLVESVGTVAAGCSAGSESGGAAGAQTPPYVHDLLPVTDHHFP